MTGLAATVRQWAARDPQRTAVVDGSARPTWTELDAAVSQAAGALVACGLGPGDRLVLQLGTGLDFATLYLAAGRAGVVVVPVNPGYTRPELTYVLADCGTKLLVTSSVAAIEAAGELPARVVVAAPSAPDGTSTLAELLAQAADDPDRDLADDELAVLLYTSGTSGRPKGAMLTAGALAANLAHVLAVEPSVLGADDIAFVPLPLFHVFGLNGGFGPAVCAGATTVLHDRFEAAGTLAVMARERVTTLVGAPVMYAQWLAEPGFADGFAAVRTAVSGSAPLTPALVGEYGRRGIVLREGYGLTEAAPGVTLNAVPPKSGSIGRPLPGVEGARGGRDGPGIRPGPSRRATDHLPIARGPSGSVGIAWRLS